MLKPPYTRYSRIYTYHLDGSGFTAIDDPDLIGMWEEDGKTILIFHKPKDHQVAEICRQNSCRLFYQADLDYDDWEMGREIAPFTVGPLTIAPIWDSAKADIRIDPSVVFGNGFHPSTRLCLESLVDYRTEIPRNFTGLDLGCGTGLLAIVAALLGASSVMAVDHNPLACTVTRQNAVYNKVEKAIMVQQADLRAGLPPQMLISSWPTCTMNCLPVFSGIRHSGRPACIYCPASCWAAKNIFWPRCPPRLRHFWRAAGWINGVSGSWAKLPHYQITGQQNIFSNDGSKVEKIVRYSRILICLTC